MVAAGVAQADDRRRRENMMGYPDNALAEGEHVVLHRHPHWKRMLRPIIALLVITALASFGAGLVSRADWDVRTRQIVWAVIGGLWLLLVFWAAVRPFLTWRSTHFVITDRRVMYRHGVLTRSGIDIPLARINSVEFRHGLFDRMVRSGTLVIESAAQDPLEFDDVPQVEQVHSLLYHEVFDGLQHGAFEA
jgi:uncharacterized membrane protein YdbT with pleckstrin-like domain